jgi:hypothetical protein
MKYRPTTENMAALIFPTWLTNVIPTGSEILGPLTLSPKFNKPTASPPRTTVKCNHERNVRSLAKETFGSTRMGRAIRFDAVLCNNGWVDIVVKAKGYREQGGEIPISGHQVSKNGKICCLKLKANYMATAQPRNARLL